MEFTHGMKMEGGEKEEKIERIVWIRAGKCSYINLTPASSVSQHLRSLRITHRAGWDREDRNPVSLTDPVFKPVQLMTRSHARKTFPDFRRIPRFSFSRFFFPVERDSRWVPEKSPLNKLCWLQKHKILPSTFGLVPGADILELLK